jgi:predicted AAA+ superfamily ATPase
MPAAVQRSLERPIAADLRRKMVFVGGPRQVGKTWLGKALIADPAAYLNWDIGEHREAILRRELPPTRDWFFDEIHKCRGWRGLLKGLYDAAPGRRRILVTGSARLDLYRYGGDSLQGRYHYYRLHPFSVAELGIASAQDFRALLDLGGFPEPFLGGSERLARRWSRQHRERLVREEIAGLEAVQDLAKLELLAIRLPDLVASPLSVNALREDLQASHRAVSRWLDIFERLYAIYRLPPFGAPRIRAVKKERKHYHFDWSVVKDDAARFENLVASHLLKWLHYRIDTQGEDLELRYFRDVDGREVDFVLTEGRKPVLMVECKWGDAPLAPGLRYLKARFPRCEAWQVSAAGTKDYETPEGLRAAPARKLLERLA